MKEVFTFDLILHGDFEGVSINDIKNLVRRALLRHVNCIEDLEIEFTERTTHDG